MHGNMLNFNGKKMSKSEGNSILPAQLVSGDHPLLDRGYSPMTVRFLFLQSHYSSELDITLKSLQDAEKGLRKLSNAAAYLSALQASDQAATLDAEVNQLMNEIVTDMCDDFNSAKAIAGLYAIAGHINIWYNGGKKAAGVSGETFKRLSSFFPAFIADVLGLEAESGAQGKGLDAAMQVIIALRKKAREEKNWPLSDQIRDELKSAGIKIMDNKDGTTTYEMES